MNNCKILKKQTIKKNFKKKYYFQTSARSCLSEILKQRSLNSKKILIPSYIGYSINEGSGIFDPIRNTGIEYSFYRFDHKLEIDTNYLIRKLDNTEPGIILFVHYFGFRDKNFMQLKEYAKAKNFIIIEDCAHAFFTFYTNPCYDSDYAIFSLHKMFPFENGGFMYSKMNNFNLSTDVHYEIFSYDIHGISEKRKQNFLYLMTKLKPLEKYNLTILRNKLYDNIPQTFPILLKSRKIRDNLYFELNKRGFGVVSLYHQLINEISNEYDVEQTISRHILNLPIHQDVSFEELDCMIDALTSLLKKFKK